MQDIDWTKSIKNDLINFLDSLKNNDYDYRPVNTGITNIGNKLSLGFNCYALKILYILGEWKEIEPEFKNRIITNLESYQVNVKKLPTNSFVDLNFFKYSKRKTAKQHLKVLLNFFGIYKYNHYEKLLNITLQKQNKQFQQFINWVIKIIINLLIFHKEINEIYKFLEQF